MDKAKKMAGILQEALEPTYLEVSNESESHRGHGGYKDGETHFKISIKSDRLTGGRVQKHRQIYQLLEGVSYHALEIIL